jgi:hypothetical protein
MLKIFSGLLDRIFAVLGALLFMQAPLFMQEYVQHLSGRVAELQWQTNQLQEMANQAGRTMTDYIEKFVSNPDLDISMQGTFMLMVIQRQSVLEKSLAAIKEAPVWKKPLVFMEYIQWDVARSTFDSYHMGIALTIEGGIYALIGVMAGVTVFAILKKILTYDFPGRRKAREEA